MEAVDAVYTFHLFSVVDHWITKELGLQYIEIYPGQKMGEGFGDAVLACPHQ